ncbi:MAG: permease, partial [Armatimonadetes bacterium]|nr:permease [Armatimonadota bacterium]
TAFALGVGLLLSYYILWNATCFLGEGVAYPGLICWSTNIAGLAIGTWLVSRVPD